MSIKVKLLLIGAFFISAVVIFGGSFYFINQESSALEIKKKHIDELILTVFERNVFFTDYLLARTDRAKQQLITRNSDIGNRITELLPLLEDQEEIDEIRYIRDVNHSSITDDIERLLALENELSPELHSLIVSSISVKSQSTVRIAQQSGQAYQKKIEDLRNTLNALMVGFGFLVFAFVVGVAIVITSVLRSLTKLHEGAKEIAKGNLTHRVTIQTRDELGLVGGAFNDMAEELAALYNKIKESKELLEDRVRAQTELLTQKVALLEKFKTITEEREHKMLELKSRARAMEAEQQP
jgi:nitrogen fixation/metabolism regulation signal transduction histidine kinase